MNSRTALAERIALQQAWLAAASALADARAARKLDLPAYRRELATLHEAGASVRFLAAATGAASSTVGDDIRHGRIVHQ